MLGETFETTVLQLTRERLKNICFMPPALLPNNEISQTWLHFCCLLFVLTFILMAGWKPFMCLFKYHTSWWFHYYITTTLGNRSIHKPVSSTNKWNRYWQQPDYSTRTYTRARAHTHTHHHVHFSRNELSMHMDKNKGGFISLIIPISPVWPRVPLIWALKSDASDIKHRRARVSRHRNNNLTEMPDEEDPGVCARCTKLALTCPLEPSSFSSCRCLLCHTR